MRQNLAWAVGYNLLGIPLAAGAALPRVPHPAQPVGRRRSHGAQLVSVLSNSLRLRGWQAKAA